jgi:hypothetical protein
MRRIAHVLALALLATMPACTAHRGLRDAARTVDKGSVLESNGGEYVVTWRSEPAPLPLDESFDLVVHVRPREARAADLTLAVDAVMPLHQHGMNVVPAIHALGDGSFRVEGMFFQMAGDWELHFDISEGAITERAQVAVQP